MTKLHDELLAIYVPMPVDKNGNGPADRPRTARTEHQVWDAATNETICTARDETAARRIVEALSRPAHPQAGEVAAWRVKDAWGDWAPFNSKEAADTASRGWWGLPAEPLYAHPQPHAEDEAELREKVVAELDQFIGHIVAIGPEKPRLKGTDREYEIPMARRVWREVFADSILKLISAARRDAAPPRWRERVAELLETANRYLQRARTAEYALKAALAANDAPFSRSELRHLRHLAEGGNGGTKPGHGFSAEDVLALRLKLKGMV